MKAYALKVPKKQGEAAIRLASTLCLLDKRLKILQKNGFLFIPLVQKPCSKMLYKLSLDVFEVVFEEFVAQTKYAKKGVDAFAVCLPQHLQESFPRSIDFVGEIAIVEVPPELIDYKHVVGKAILESYKKVRTVLAKSGAVDGVYRLRSYEVIGGVSSMETVHRENGCKFFLDLSKVYFSPRLSYEHLRVASQVKERETVIDMFAGVGPFSVLAAKLCKKVKIYAVDVNPEAVKYLEKNVFANRVSGKVTPILGDVRKIVGEKMRGIADRVIMNLPERSLEYVDVACESLKPEGAVVHYYEFAKGSNATATVKKHLVEAVSKSGRCVQHISFTRIVREVAPFKWQIVIDAIIK